MFRSLKIASLAASTLFAVSVASAAGEAPAASDTARAAKAAPAPAAKAKAPAASAAAAPAAQPAATAPAAVAQPAAATSAAQPTASAPAAKAPAAGAQPAAPNAASTGTPCEDVKQTIAAKLSAKGVKVFKLDVVAKDQVGTAKVVGSCQAGAMKITYKKG